MLSDCLFSYAQIRIQVTYKSSFRSRMRGASQISQSVITLIWFHSFEVLLNFQAEFPEAEHSDEVRFLHVVRKLKFPNEPLLKCCSTTRKYSFVHSKKSLTTNPTGHQRLRRRKFRRPPGGIAVQLCETNSEGKIEELYSQGTARFPLATVFGHLVISV